MKIGTIVTATDLNPLYVEFIPIFVQAWKKIVPDADICILMIANEIPLQYQPYKEHIKLFPPLEGMKTAFQAQCIRLLYPREVQRDEGVIITDMDILPLSRRYFVDSIKDIAENHYVIYRNVCMPEQIVMCYNVAHPKVWRSIFGEETTEAMLRKWYPPTYSGIHGGDSWATDQIQLAKYVLSWHGPKKIFTDQELAFNRLDRETNIFHHPKRIIAMIKTGKLCDYHAWRPQSTYQSLNNWIIRELP